MASSRPTPDVTEARRGFAQPDPAARPMVRWWWFGPDVDLAELERELRAMADAGLGGAEIAYVYPLSTPAEADAPGGLMGSTAFLAALRHAVEFGASLGLRIDLTLGSGWSFGGPHITPDLASRRLAWDRRELTPGPWRLPVVAPFPGDRLVAAFLGVGSAQEPPTGCVPLDVSDGVLHVPDGLGPRQLLLAWSRLTGQNVKRAASGAEGPVLDHYRADAVRAHLRAVGDRLLDAVDPRLVGSVFCDSLEVYDANWTDDLPDEFEARRGYPLLPRLAELVVDVSAQPSPAEGGGGEARRPSDALRADFHRTLTELYEERFVDVVQAWATGRGVPFRLQGYGVPPASVGSYRVDMVEGEGWGWRDLTSAKWAVSAAHERGLGVVSAEAWTWVHSPSFRATPLDLLGEAHEHLLAGVNHLIGHGWPYSPGASGSRPGGVGWIFYASGALDDRNAWWPAAPALHTYLTRLSWLLRQGDPVAEVTVLLPTEDVYAGLGPELDLYRAARRHVTDELTRALRTGGWDYVLVDDAVADAGARPRPVVVVPHATRLPGRTRAWLEEQQAAGTAVILVGGTLELPGALRVPDAAGAGFAGVLAGVLPPDVVVDPQPGDVGVRHRRLADADVWFVANTGPFTREVTVRPRGGAAAFERWDAQTGETERIGTGGADAGGVRLVLAAYEAAVLVGLHDAGEPGIREERPTAPAAAVADPASPHPGSLAAPLAGWRVVGAGVDKDVTLPHVWEEDPDVARLSGTLTYTTTVQIAADDVHRGRWVLDLGPTEPTAAGGSGEEGLRGHSFRAEVLTPVGEVAEVVLNGRSLGFLWHPPYALDVTDAVRPGANDLRLVVSSTSAHALADDPHLTDLVATVTERFGRRFVLQDIADADQGVRSGLLGQPTLSPRAVPPR